MSIFKLHNGNTIPAMGFGVFRIPAGEATAKAVSDAIAAGYRHIDTAQGYWNEADVGEGIRISGIRREELFIATKLWMYYYHEEAAYASILASLEKLGTKTIDLMLLHQAVGDYYGAWRAMERLYREGVLKNIGVSNFTAERLTDLCLHAKIQPVVNQIHVSPYNQVEYLKETHERYHVRMASWSPFESGSGALLADPVLVKIGARYGKSSAQVILRWLYQRGIVSLARTVHQNRMKENLDIFDFALTDDDMAMIATLDKAGSDEADLKRAATAESLFRVVEKHADEY